MSNYSTVVVECASKWSKSNQARRLFHGRGHTFPGLEHVTVTAWAAYLQIVFHQPVENSVVDDLVDALCSEITDVAGVVVQQRAGRGTQSKVVRGDVPDEVVAAEGGLDYWIQPTRNQNVGLFLDMGHVRQDIALEVEGKKVLNLFAYTCAFSVSALHHGAASVVNNDMSRNALELGNRNHQLNGQDTRRVRMIPHNLFKSWWKIRQFGPYDVIIIDPPTNQRGSFVAEKSYGQVLKRLSELANPDATIIASLNSPFLGSDFLHNQMARWAPEAAFVSQYPLHLDFPDAFPERALKVMKFKYG
ncbi:MAG: methyltransferase [Pseudomonadales bacterium]|nr:methyltransferase [Pseudomonadales bacterium]